MKLGCFVKLYSFKFLRSGGTVTDWAHKEINLYNKTRHSYIYHGWPGGVLGEKKLVLHKLWTLIQLVLHKLWTLILFSRQARTGSTLSAGFRLDISGTGLKLILTLVSSISLHTEHTDISHPTPGREKQNQLETLILVQHSTGKWGEFTRCKKKHFLCFLHPNPYF